MLSMIGSEKIEVLIRRLPQGFKPLVRFEICFQSVLVITCRRKIITQSRNYVGSRLLLELLHVHSSDTMLDFRVKLKTAVSFKINAKLLRSRT